MSMSDKEMMKWLKEDGERLDKIDEEKKILAKRKSLFEVFNDWDMNEGLKTFCVDEFIRLTKEFRIKEVGNLKYITIYENDNPIRNIWDVTGLYEFFKK